LTILITSFLCPTEESRSYAEPVNIVATPVSTTPAFLTTNHTLIFVPPNTVATNVQIDIFSWDASGAPAPNIVVNWRCRVPTAPFIVIQ
jgi:hypothetical protein